MTLIQLRYLIAIVDCGFSISQAARELHTSQPGISRQVRLLEQQLGTAILARSAGRIIGLTESGERAVQTARRVVGEMESLELMSQEYLTQESGTFVVGSLHTYALSLLPPALAAVQAKYPKVVVDVQQTPLAESIALVLAGEIDVALTIGQPPAGSQLLALPVADIPLKLIVPTGHELLSLETLELTDLLRYPMVCLASSSTSWGVSSVFKAHGHELHPSAFAMDASVMQAFVASDMGIAVVPATLPAVSGVQALEVSHLFPPSPVVALLNPNRFMRGYLYTFLEHLAPQWTRHRIHLEIRDALFGAAELTPNKADQSLIQS